MATKPKNIVFFHPDLGIGGAERLIVDAAVGLQDLGHRVTIFTSHCDPAHCFDEARDGTLDVRVRGNTIVPPTILGRFAILCAILRQVHLILHISIFTDELRQLAPRAFVVDQLSAGVPLLRLVYPPARILFYCHFPDKLLAQKGGLVKSLYRKPFDAVESWSTGCSDGIVVNSNFTRGVFRDVFPGLRSRSPKVIYPCVDTSGKDAKRTDEEPPWPGKKFILSINRFERKKDVGLAIKAYAALPQGTRGGTRLVIAGGYDPRVPENVSYHTDLAALAETLDLPHATARNAASALAIPENTAVLFLLSVPNALKASLLKHATLLVYTPLNEHFGIVPLEAMLAETPVLAADKGGPLETVVEGETGWLRDVNRVEDWTEVMRRVLDGTVSEAALSTMGEKGRKRVRGLFSKGQMAVRFQEEIAALENGARPPVLGGALLGLSGLLAALCAILVYFSMLR